MTAAREHPILFSAPNGATTNFAWPMDCSPSTSAVWRSWTHG